MNLLLDTHTFLWLISGDTALSFDAWRLIEDEANTSLLSVASLWEMAIKHSIGKLSFTQPFDLFIPHQLTANGIAPLPIKLEHVNLVATLPPHHKDPFDRLIAAQALTESLPLVSVDANLDAYSVRRLW